MKILSRQDEARPFDEVLSVYNLKASNTRYLRAGINRASIPASQTGAGLCRIAIFGDSKSDTYNGNGPAGHDNVYSKWPHVLKRRLLQSIAGLNDGGTGYIKTWHAGIYDPRLTLTGTWTNSSGGPYSYTTTNGDTITLSTLATGEKGTIVDAIVANYQADQWSLSADGNTSGTGYYLTTNTNGGAAWRLGQLTGLPDTTHSIVWKNVASNPGADFITGLALRRSYGLVIDNYSLNGGGSPHFISGTTGVGGVAKFYTPNPDLLIIALGGNDLASTAFNLSVSTTIANLTTIRNLYPNSDVMLVLYEENTAVPQATWQSYGAAMYNLADTLDIPLIDIYNKVGVGNTLTQFGLAVDGTHQNGAGDSLYGDAMAKAIASVL